jgi:hypothetical protein
MKTTLILFALSLLLWSCKDCGDTSSETKIRLEFNGLAEEPVFQKIIAAGANREVSLVKMVTKKEPNPHYYLPIPNTENGATYYFFRPGRTDTLMISYERKMEFKSNECGFTMNLEKFDLVKNTLSTNASITDGDRSPPFDFVDNFDPYIRFFD